jgi:adenine-specific DNA-methyltransferase
MGFWHHNHKIEKIKQILPEIVKDGQIDIHEFEKLVEGYEIEEDYSYSFNWPGKDKAKKGAYIPTTLTLKPNKDKSKKFDETNNLYIEGDNLSVLKILRDSYSNKVDLIYIDPPYNTGNEFVYPDDFEAPYREYKKTVGIEDSEGKELTTNKDTSGRKHTNWLNMMYPRLLLAKDFLSKEGVIFISIDDNEQANLKKMCDEIFGEQNFLAQVIWERAYAPVNLKKNFSESHDYILVYAKNIKNVETDGIPRGEAQDSLYKNPDNDPRGPWQSDNFSVGPAVESNIYEIITPSGRSVYPPSGYSWRFSEEKYKELIADNQVWFGQEGDGVPRYKRFLKDVKQGVTPMTLWKYEDVGHSQSASQSLKRLMDDKAYFSYPKPISLIKQILQLYSKKDSIIMDFFAGSSTTAHATMELNAEDGGDRKFIMVQIPEPLKEGGVAYKDGFRNLSEISQERIHRAGEQIKIDYPHVQETLDIGFKTFELTDTNFPQWNEEIELENINEQLNMLNEEVTDELASVYEIMILLKIYQLDETVSEVTPHLYSVGSENKSLVTVVDELDQEMYEWLNENHEDYYQVIIYDNALSQEQKLNLIGNLEEKLFTV